MLVFRGVTLLMSPNFPSATLRPEMLMCLRLPTVTPVSCKGCSSDLRAPAWNVRAANKGPLVSCSFFSPPNMGVEMVVASVWLFFHYEVKSVKSTKKRKKKINPVKFLTPDSSSSEKQTRKSPWSQGGQFSHFPPFWAWRPFFVQKPSQSIHPTPKTQTEMILFEKKKEKSHE